MHDGYIIPRRDVKALSFHRRRSNLASLPLGKLNQSALRDRVVTSIRDAVIQGRLRPGDKVPEDELASVLGVSRTPVREAIRILEMQGLVVVRPKKGTYVATVEAADEADGLSVRAALEELAVRQALGRSTPTSWESFCKRLDRLVAKMATTIDQNDLVAAVEADMEFHSSLIAAAENKYLSRTWHLVGVPFLVWSPERDLYSHVQPEWTSGFVDGHRDLVAALRTRDADDAARAATSHVMGKLQGLAGTPAPG
jgi:DNA-binding GntR family transcriptional regulator